MLLKWSRSFSGPFLPPSRHSNCRNRSINDKVMIKMWFREVHCVERVEQLIPRRLRKSWTLVHSAGETYDEIISKSGHKQRSYSNIVLLIYDFSLTFPHRPRGKQVGALPLISCGGSPDFLSKRSAMSFTLMRRSCCSCSSVLALTKSWNNDVCIYS